MTRDELIAALEAATRPSRELDVAIVYVLYPDIGPYASHCAGDPPIFWFDPYYKQECPLFTASIDAALTLVPEGWTWMASNRATAPRAGRAYIHNGEMIHGGIGHMTRNPLYRGVECTAATPAIALCIAALRARP